MANLLGQNIGTNYRGILNIGSTINTPLGSTLSTITDGMGNNSTLQLSTSLTKIDSNLITGGATAASARLHVRGDGTNPIARFDNGAGTAMVTVNQSSLGANLTFANALSIAGNTGTTQFVSPLGSVADNVGNTPVFRYTQAGVDSSVTNAISTFFQIDKVIASGAGSTSHRILNVVYSINASGAQTGTATGIFLNATETNLNGLVHNLLDLQVGGVSRFRVRANNNIDIFGATQLNWSTYSAYIYHDGSSFQFSTPQSILFNAASNLYKFGGTTNLFPALKRNGANLEVRLADDSDYANLNCGTGQFFSTLTTARVEMNGDYLGLNSFAIIRGSSNGIVAIQPWTGNDLRINMASGANETSLINGTGSPEGVVTARIGSIYMRKDGGANTTLYIKESGTGNTGWVAK